jgi:D-arabinose 5-phosphate isomerase GutQ
MVSNSAHALEIARQLINSEADTVRAVADQIELFSRQVDLALAATGKIFTVGSVTSGMIARRLAHLLSACGSASMFLHTPWTLCTGAPGPWNQDTW